jgi:hypothetical protein
MGLTREQLLFSLGILKYGPQIDKYTHRAYVAYEEKVWRENRDNKPHGRPWHTSFHASSFPGSEKACGRREIYTLMDIPSTEPAPPHLRATGEMGKAAESQIVFRWAHAGLLLGGSSPLKDGGSFKQLGFEDPETWLTGSIDAVLGLPTFPHVLPVDIKSKAKHIIDQMKVGALSYDPKHYAQVQAYCYLCHKFYDEMGWEEIGFKRPVGAIIYYVSRENPRHTHEFFVDIDWPFINRGLENLKNWRQAFESGILPERPKEWKWTEEPCKWCKFKKMACKPDVKEGTTNLRRSQAVTFAKSIRPTYSIDETMEGVTNRWLQSSMTESQ